MPLPNSNRASNAGLVTVETVRAERIEQGRPATITDPATLATIAAACRPVETIAKRAA